MCASKATGYAARREPSEKLKESSTPPIIPNLGCICRGRLQGETMRVTINGRAEEIGDGASVADLLKQLKLEPIRVAVEINEDLVPRKEFPGKRIEEGDRIEVVTFVGGG